VKPFRKNVGISIDGGGIRGIMVARALAVLEECLGRTAHDIFRLAAGTSTGAIIAAGIGAGFTAKQIAGVYAELGEIIFRKSWRSRLWPLLSRYRYGHDALQTALEENFGDMTMGDFWSADPRTDVVLTLFDLVANKTHVVSSSAGDYARWPVSKAVLASISVPGHFPVVDGRYIDGTIGSYGNPCYLAAAETANGLAWNPAQTTLISLGTGRNATQVRQGDAARFRPWNWIRPVIGAYQKSADDQQLQLVRSYYQDLDFRRFQIDLDESIEVDDAHKMTELIAYGDKLAEKILNDEMDGAVL
jgi:patatin-like phospholipase/acyl hydrolase